MPSEQVLFPEVPIEHELLLERLRCIVKEGMLGFDWAFSIFLFLLDSLESIDFIDDPVVLAEAGWLAEDELELFVLEFFPC